jgi:hypothetical protein
MRAPRVPRDPVAPLELGLTLIMGLLAVGVGAWLVLWWKLLQRLIGWALP